VLQQVSSPHAVVVPAAVEPPNPVAGASRRPLEVTYRLRGRRLPRDLRRVLGQCPVYLTYTPADPDISMMIQFEVPAHLQALIAAHAGRFVPVSQQPSVLPFLPQELLRAAGDDAALRHLMR
jgi:hypothetical protein